MEKKKNTQAHANANKRYDSKTYKRFNIAFRLDDDAEIIEALEKAHSEGIAGREIISMWYSAANK